MSTFRGYTATRTIKALAMARGWPGRAEAFAKGSGWRDVDDVIASIKAVVAPTGTDDVGLPTPAGFDFAEFVRPMTILGKLVGLRRVPSRVRAIAATAGSSASWSGESQPRPISRLTLNGATLEPLGVTAVTVATIDLLKSSSPGAESILSRDLAAAAVGALDSAFIDPANAGVADVKPASITNGVTPIASTGSSLAQIDADLEDMIAALDLAGSDLQFAAWVLRPRTAVYLAKLRGTGGALAFPGMTAKGGILLGLPAITSNHVPVEVGSPGDGDTSITLLDAAQILVTDDGSTGFEVSENATIAMSDEPTSPVEQVSMFQTDSVALRTTRFANWRRCRDGMAQVLSGVTY
ncbi:MAG: phage major capsid protein [Steroidobacteraceae bacterium]